ncbi:glycosyltransferase family 4 protein [Streptomonospora nanhaiensis]|uniref:Glycosyltransferase involved in cell wall biosynthesis n=1 Tax=Streptomonospora nanhaiensis TaxID=1323731 RepID=A0A853BWP2_9ACTN|nr:glycosyltransferase family 4 protein [Streptomonospora nanhaiensis]MBV2365685.1 glycosyltransferase family 4 protein [Streptomonospora nanhaiensis]MBX9388141.1 glycosyltransferase family 4 protein [Streptomonospora nanhaiensis]NYI98877.1 glycosyltransferase involved in cell wall biosynthesis [Streptomonospora nanhaiensis]
MRIALVIGVSSGGVGNHVRALAEGLAARGHRVAVLGPAGTEERFGFTAVGARFAAVDIGGTPRPLHDTAALARLSALCAKADVVHAHGVRAGALCALAGAAPLAVTVHNAPPRLRGPAGLVFPVLERVVARRAEAVLAVSGDLEARMRRGGARRVRPAVVAAPPLAALRRPPHLVRAELGAGEGPLVLVVARLAAQKGIDVLLRAAPAICARTPRPVIAVAGEGPLRARAEAAVRERGLPVRLLGHRADVADLLAAADVFVLPSRWEGPSLVVMEALRAQLPVVATCVGGIPDRYAESALLVAPEDPDALARAVGGVLDDPDLAARLRTRAARAAAHLPTEDDVLDQVLGVYATLRGGGGRPRFTARWSGTPMRRAPRWSGTKHGSTTRPWMAS